jgi:hypothetical protein
MAANLRVQNWTGVAIELAIVIVGVFIGMEVSNWNQARIDRRETVLMLEQLAPELQLQIKFLETAKSYYATTRQYADQALAGWQGDRSISDEQFIIAAYQASQVYGIIINADNWSLMFGGEDLRNIDDPALRRNMELVLTQDYGPVRFEAVSTNYREQVRRVIPIHIQDRIRQECGDRGENYYLTTLPPTCSMRIAPAEAKRIAAALRARPELAGELHWHLAAVAAYLNYAALIEQPIRALHGQLVKPS